MKKTSLTLSWLNVFVYTAVSGLFVGVLMSILFYFMSEDVWRLVSEHLFINALFLTGIALVIGLLFFTKEKKRFDHLTVEITESDVRFTHRDKTRVYSLLELTDIRLERQLYSFSGKAKVLIRFHDGRKRAVESFLVDKESIKDFALEFFKRKEEAL